MARVVYLSLAFGFFFFLLAKSMSATDRPLLAWGMVVLLVTLAAYLFPESRYAWAAFGAVVALFSERIIKRERDIWRQFASARKGRNDTR